MDNDNKTLGISSTFVAPAGILGMFLLYSEYTQNEGVHKWWNGNIHNGN